jgi:hypothetical protein
MSAIPPTNQDRLLAAIRDLIRAEFPNLIYSGTFEYSVQDTDGTTVDAVPTDSTIGLPPLTKVPLRTGLAGGTCKPKIGSLLAVGFLNSDPTRPRVFGVFDRSTAQSVKLSTDTLTVDAGTGTAEHFITAEAVINLFLNFLYLLQSAGNPTTWSSPGKIFDPSDPTLTTVLFPLFTTWLSAASNPLLTISPAAGGGLFWPTYYAVMESNVTSKVTDLAGFAPGLGCPNVKGG